MIAVVDIDGVLADATHRQHHLQGRPKDWDAFFAAVGEDPPIPRGIARLGELSLEHDVVLLSGRPERTRADTENWLARHGIEVSGLVLRSDADHRPAADLKADLIARIAAPTGIAVVVDDDATVVGRISELGYRAELFR
jgi:hypothetical protein